MKDSKLISLLKLQSLRKLNKFSEYIHSPFFNKRPILEKLCDYLMRSAPLFEDKYRLKKETIYKHLYPKQAYNNSTLHRLSSQLLNLFHDFLVDYHWREQKLDRQVILLQELRKAKANKHHNLAVRRYQSLLKEEEHSQSEQYYKQYQLHRELDMQFIEQGGRQFNENLQLQSDNLDLHFLIEKLHLACDMASRNVVIQADYKCGMLDDLLHFLENSDYAEVPVIKIHLATYWMVSTAPPEDEQHYNELKRLLHEFADLFTDKELYGMYDYPLNYSIKQINRGRQNYYRELLDHYQFLVGGRKILFIDGALPAWDYKNIVTIALRLEEYEWTENFIHEYRQYLQPDVRENVYRFNLASYYYETGDYGKALRALYNIDFINPTYHLGAKMIQLKSYYQLDEAEALLSLIGSFNNYLRRHKKISEYRKQTTLNCIKLAKRIFSLKEKKDFVEVEKYKTEYNKVATELQNTSPLTNKEWLESCMEQLKA